jgi:cobalt-zinc-cadmium resistance protein CzcA
MSNVRGRDLGGFVAEVGSKLEREITLPTGYFIEYGGQFENQQRAMRRLALIVPIVIGVIFVLLYVTFNSLKQALLVVGNVPFAFIGGVAALWIRGMNLNLSVLYRVHCVVWGCHVERSSPRQFNQSATLGR